MGSRLEALMQGDVSGALRGSNNTTKQYTHSAFDCVRIQLVSSSSALAWVDATSNDTNGDSDQGNETHSSSAHSNSRSLPATCFAPEYVHQVFGEQEQVVGYMEPLIVLAMHKKSCKAMLCLRYTNKRAVAASKPTDVPALFREWMPQGFAQSFNEFDRLLNEEDGTCLPEHVASRAFSSEELHANSIAPNAPNARCVILPFREHAVRSWFERVEVLSILFIDGARMLEGADTNWEVFVMLMKDSEGEESIAGFAAVHSYFTWPNKRRLRVSQLAVLPPFRRQSVASTLLELIRTVALEREYIDVTFEDPSDQLLNIRSVLDTSKVMSRGGEWLQQKVSEAVDAALTADSHKEQLSALRMPQGAVSEGQKHFCICAKQMQRCWESLLYAEAEQRGVQTAQKAYGAFKDLIRKRLETGVAEEVKDDAKNKHLIDTETGFVMSKNKGLIGTVMQHLNVTPIDFNEEEMQQADEEVQQEHEKTVQASVKQAVSVAQSAKERLNTKQQHQHSADREGAD